MIILEVIITFIKKYWKYLAIGGAGLALAGYVYFQKSSNDNNLKQVENSYLAQIAQINSLREQEYQAHQKNLETLQNQLTEIQSKYDSAKKALEAKKVAQTNKIMQDTNGNPDELAQRLSKATGIPIVK
jgi:DNA-binding protein H-NS